MTLEPALHAAVLAVGSELLVGDQLDTNSAWISERLSELGVSTRFHLSAPDTLDQLVDAISWLIDRVDLLVVGGGLGPTHDDLTREALAEAADLPLEHREELAEEIRQRFASVGMHMPERNLKQALIPKGATAIAPRGTAPGFLLEITRGEEPPCTVFALPGVPWELQEMFLDDVAPWVRARTGGASVTRTVHISGMGESAVSEALGDEIDRWEEEGFAVALLAKSGEIQLRLTSRAATAEDARAASEPVVAEAVRVLGRAVSGIDGLSLEDAVIAALREAEATVALAESCTAGAVAARLAAVPGASFALRGGAVVYATETKHQVLGVPDDVLAEHGPVSEEVTRELAVRVRELFGADYGIGITGVAGPTEQNGVPVGTVYWALAGPDSVDVYSRQLPGDRAAVQARVGSAALETLRRRLMER